MPRRTDNSRRYIHIGIEPSMYSWLKSRWLQSDGALGISEQVREALSEYRTKRSKTKKPAA